MSKKLTVKAINDLTTMIGGLGSDSIVVTTLDRGKKKRPGEPEELTSFVLAPGSWIIAGQGSFSVNGASDTQLEYKLSLQYSSSNKVTGGRHTYMSINGGAFGSPIVIDAVVLDRLTTVTLLYQTQGGKAPWSLPKSASLPPGTSVRDQILMAVKTSNLLTYKP